MSEFPSHWRVTPFCNLVILKRGVDLPVQQREEGEIPIYGSNGIVGFHSKATQDHPGIVTGRSGSIGNVYLHKTPFWALNTTLYSEQTHGNHIEYIYHFLKWFDLSRFSGGTGVPTLNRNDVHDQNIGIPPLPEQKKIAEILSGIDQELDRCNACLSRTNLLRTSLLKSMMKDAEEQPINHPLGNIVEVINGRAYKLTEWENEGTPVIRLQNLTKQGGNFYYSNLRLPEKQYCNKGDLLFMWSASFGPHIWWGDKAIYHYHIWKMVPRGDSILKNYLYLYLQYKTEEWKSQGSGMAMIHLTKEGIEKEVVPLPSVTAQEKVVYTMKSIDERITALKKKAGKYSLLKNAMSSDLLSGRKRVSI